MTTMFNTNYPMPNEINVLASSKNTVEEKLNALNAAIDEKKDMQTVKNCEAAVKNAIKELNAKIAEQWLDEVKSMDKVEAANLYINLAGELGAFRLKNPAGEEIHYEVTSTKRFLSFKTFNKVMNVASSSVYNIMISRFLDNINMSVAGNNNGIGAKALISNTKKAESEKAGSDFVGYSNKKLEKQLNLIVKAMLPEEAEEIKMKLQDVRYIIHCITKGITGTSAGVETGDTKAITKAIVSAIRVRVNGGEYEQTSKDSQYKDAKSK